MAEPSVVSCGILISAAQQQAMWQKNMHDAFGKPERLMTVIHNQGYDYSMTHSPFKGKLDKRYVSKGLPGKGILQVFSPDMWLC